MTEPISSLTGLAAVARNLAGFARAERRQFSAAVVRRKHEAVGVAALEHALPAVHLPRRFSLEIGGPNDVCSPVLLQGLQLWECVSWKLRIYVSKCAEMPQAAPQQQRKMSDEQRVQHVGVTSEQAAQHSDYLAAGV